MSDTLKHTGSAFVGGPIITADSVQSTLKIPDDLKAAHRQCGAEKGHECFTCELIERIARVEQERDVKAQSDLRHDEAYLLGLRAGWSHGSGIAHPSVYFPPEKNAEIEASNNRITAAFKAAVNSFNVEVMGTGGLGIFGNIPALLEAKNQRIAELKRQLAEKQRALDLLTDPAAVYTNILRGTLPLTKAQAIHIAGLPADIKEQLAEANSKSDEYLHDAFEKDLLLTATNERNARLREALVRYMAWHKNQLVDCDFDSQCPCSLCINARAALNEKQEGHDGQ